MVQTIVKGFIILLITGFFHDVSAAVTCDQNLPSVKIRAGSTQYFTDALTNRTGYEIGVSSDGITFNNVYSGSDVGPRFEWTTNMVSKGYKVQDGATNLPMFVSGGYPVQIPPTGSRRYSDAINIVYKIRYWENLGSTWRGPYTHTECQPYEITWCGDGVIDSADGEACDPADTSRSGWGTSGCSASCQPVNTPPSPDSCDALTVNPSTGTAPLSVAISCSATSAVNYLIECGNGTNITSSGGTCNYTANGSYAPKCTINNTITSPSCTKTVTVSDTPLTSSVEIKKYAKEITAVGDSQTTPVRLTPGESFSYFYQVRNTSANAAIDVMVKDTFPQHMTYSGVISVRNASNVDVTSDWIIQTGSRIFPGDTLPRITLVAKKRTPLPANSGVYTFTIPVVLSATVPTGANLQNVAYVCASNDPSNPTICNNDDPPPPPPPDDCTTVTPGDQIDPACIDIGGNFDLSVKKYVKGDDIFAGVLSTEDYNYNIIVTNNGTESSTGVTTVRDILPLGVTLQAGLVPSGNGWTCTRASDRDFTCTTTRSVPSKQVYDTITVPARVNGLTFRPSAYVNYAYVSNPYEAVDYRCRADNTTPDPSLAGQNGENPQAVCNRDSNNFDPATVSPPNPTGFDLILTKYVNGNDDSSRANADGSINYTFVVRNLGALASSGRTTVRDIDFPVGISPLTIQTSQNGWTCANITGGFECVRDDSLAAGAEFPVITLVARQEMTIAPGTYRNVACVSNPNDPHEGALYNPDLGQYKVNNCNPARVVVVPPGTFDLTIVKRVGNNLTDGTLRDRNTAIDGNGEQNILITGQNAPLVYTYEIRNLGPVTATGLTTVEDTLPSGITISGSVQNQNGWTCTSGTNGNRSWTCTRTEDLVLGASFPTIMVFARSDAAIAAGIYSNIATVRNPGDSNPNNNSDPANVRITLQASCGGLTASPNVSPNAPNTPITYTCSAAGFSGPVANLEYDIVCGTNSIGFTGSATRVCPLPATTSTPLTTTCSVRDRTNPTVIFSGSAVGACTSTITTTGGGGGGGGPSHVGKKCVNGAPQTSCAYYNSIIACELDVGRGNCDSADIAGLNRCQARPLSCSGGGGGGGGNPDCGDGILQPALGEECDLGRGSNSNASGATCSLNCKVRGITTNPGANPLTDIWMNIPLLSRARIGYGTFLDVDTSRKTGKIPFEANGMVIGSGTQAFSLADTVGFGIKSQYVIPFIIRSDKTICLSSSGSSLNSNEICTMFGSGATPIQKIDICGVPYTILGRGDYQIPDARICAGQPGVYIPQSALNNIPNNIIFFRGNDLYRVYPNRLGVTSLNSAFFGRQVGDDGKLTLSNGSITRDPLTAVPLVSLRVRVSEPRIGNTAGTINRGIERYLERGNLINAFLAGIKSNTTTTANTTTTTTRPIVNVNVATNTTGNKTVGSVADLTRLAVNGNQNILSVKNGDLTIDACGANKTLILDGVRTVIVENGNLIINCNIAYQSGDSSASWAFVVKNGSIIVYPGTTVPADFGVTNLAGVYVAIPGDQPNSGTFRSLGNITSQRILKVDGSMYGDANPLFNSRLYVRGTNAYEILTTGVILSYSNRALVSPPPLLSEYLNNYSVTRVVK